VPFVQGGGSHVECSRNVAEGLQSTGQLALRAGELALGGQVLANQVRSSQRSYPVHQADFRILGEGQSLLEESRGHLPALPHLSAPRRPDQAAGEMWGQLGAPVIPSAARPAAAGQSIIRLFKFEGARHGLCLTG
jgi:hypothetical protein